MGIILLSEALLHYVREGESAVLVFGYKDLARDFHRRNLLLQLLLVLRKAACNR